MTTAEIAATAKLTDEARLLAKDGIGPSRFVGLLEERSLFQDAIRFLACGFPVALAIEWGCRCIRELTPSEVTESSKTFGAAEAWLKSPNDENRRKAREAADQSEMPQAADLLAMAVFFSGGSITPAGAPETPPPEYVASRLAAGGIIMAVLSRQPEKADERYRKTLGIGRQLVKTKTQG